MTCKILSICLLFLGFQHCSSRKSCETAVVHLLSVARILLKYSKVYLHVLSAYCFTYDLLKKVATWHSVISGKYHWRARCSLACWDLWRAPHVAIKSTERVLDQLNTFLRICWIWLCRKIIVLRAHTKVEKHTASVLRKVRAAMPISLNCLHCSAFPEPARKFLQRVGSSRHFSGKHSDARESICFPPPRSNCFQIDVLVCTAVAEKSAFRSRDWESRARVLTGTSPLQYFFWGKPVLPPPVREALHSARDGHKFTWQRNHYCYISEPTMWRV